MKKDYKLLKAAAVIILIAIIYISTTKDANTNKKKETNPMPFESISVLEKNIPLRSEKTDYEINVDCTKLSKNRQIVSYKLKKEYQDSNISVNVKVYKDSELLKEKYEGATNLDITLTKKDNIKYNIKAKCD